MERMDTARMMFRIFSFLVVALLLHSTRKRQALHGFL
jgi:hypothetical protein